MKAPHWADSVNRAGLGVWEWELRANEIGGDEGVVESFGMSREDLPGARGQRNQLLQWEGRCDRVCLRSAC